METLTQLHKRALKEHWAVPHFNFSSLAQLNGILDALREMHAPAVLGTSEGERDFIGLKQSVYLIKSFREKEEVAVFLNADHSYSFETAKKAFDAGYDSIHIDLSKEEYKKNIEDTKRVVDYVKGKNPEVEVEGELGYIVTGSSKIYKEIIEIPEDSYTRVEEAIDFVAKTGIDRFAPAIGNIHGIAVNKPSIKFNLVNDLRDALPNVTFVLHGGSGIGDKDMKKLVKMGINNIHISTELRVAYTDALRKELNKKQYEIAPYHYLDKARKMVAEKVKEKLKIFGAEGRL